MENNIGFWIKKISDRLLSELNCNLKKYNITARQLDTLIYINENQMVSQKDIADYFGIRHTTVIDLISKLEEKKLIVKTKNNNNLKYNDIYLTDFGKKQVEELESFRDDIQNIAVQELGKENIEHLISTLKTIYDRICEYDKTLMSEGKENGV